MSEFANPASTAAGPQAESYATAVIRALGSRDPLGVLREMPDRLAAIGRANVRLFERASNADLARVGMHSERGEESLGYMLKLYAGHDIVHLRQIERIRRAVS